MDLKRYEGTIKSSAAYPASELLKKDFLHLGEMFAPEFTSYLALRFSDTPALFSSTFYMGLPSTTPWRVITEPLGASSHLYILIDSYFASLSNSVFILDYALNYFGSKVAGKRASPKRSCHHKTAQRSRRIFHTLTLSFLEIFEGDGQDFRWF